MECEVFTGTLDFLWTVAFFEEIGVIWKGKQLFFKQKSVLESCVFYRMGRLLMNEMSS